MFKVTFRFTNDFGKDTYTCRNAESLQDEYEGFIGVIYSDEGRRKTRLFNRDKVLAIDFSRL